MFDVHNRLKVPVAIMPVDLIDKAVVVPTMLCAQTQVSESDRRHIDHIRGDITINEVSFPFRAGMSSSNYDPPYLVPESASAVRMFFDYVPQLSLDATPQGLGHSIAVLIVNKLDSALNLKVGGDGGKPYYGNVCAYPTYRAWNEDHRRHDLPGPDYEIPAGNGKDKTAGLGLFGIKWTNGFYGCAAGLEITSDDPNLSGPLWFACQDAYGETNGRRLSVGVTDDLSRYKDLEHYYRKDCDDSRYSFMICRSPKGAGKEPNLNYKVTAAIAGLDPCSAASKDDHERKYIWTAQAVLVIESDP